MKIHHLNCGTMCPLAGRLMGYESLICHCLLIESNQGLILVDTGLSVNQLTSPKKYIPLNGFFGVRAGPNTSALRQIEALGYSAKDVRHIIPTHLDFDHVGALCDFPEAEVHVYNLEHKAITRPNWQERLRYNILPLTHTPKWIPYSENGEPWFGFECVRQLQGLPPEILLIPLVGHSRGHCGVAVNAGTHWFLHAGDAYMYHREIDADKRRCPAFVRMFEWAIQHNGKKRMWNLGRLRLLANQHSQQVKVFSAHSPVYFKEYTQINSNLR